MITEWVSERCYWPKKQESLWVYYCSPVKNTFLENTNIFMNLEKEIKPQEKKSPNLEAHGFHWKAKLCFFGGELARA